MTMTPTPGGRVGDSGPVGTPGGRQNWVDQAGGLDPYLRQVAHALIRQGHSKSQAIRMAWGILRNWATGKGNVSPKVRAAAAKSVANMEAKRARTTDLSTPQETTVSQLDRAALDLAVRDYVRDNVGKFSTTGSTRPAAGSSTIGKAGDRAAIGKVGGKPGIDRERVDPAGVKTLADIRRIMRAWRRVPFAQRAALKARLITKAKSMGADPRLLLLLSGLGDADGKREATEGSSRAIRRGNAREWLAKQRGLDMSDPVTALAVDLLDLSPGDYSPPYDWKHGFIPLTPAAVASKAGKGPNAGKGGKRAKAPRKSAAATPKPRKVAAGKPTKAAAPKSAKAATPKPDTSQLATDQRADDARRGGGFPVPPELRNAKTKNGTPFPTVTPMAKASPLNDDPGTSLNGKSAASMTNAERIRAAEAMFGTDSPQAKAARAKWGDNAPAKPAGTGRFADKGKAPEANPRREKFDQAAQASRDGDHAKAARLYGELGDEDKTARERAKAIKAGQDLPGYTAPSVAAEKKAGGITPSTVRRMSDDQLEKVLDRLGAAGDFTSPSFKAVEAEQNRRDDARESARKAGKAPRR